MNPFVEIERVCATLIERSFARIFPSRLEPVHIARRLIAVLEATSPPPTLFIVRMHPSDYAAFEPELADLCASWEDMIAETAERMHLSLLEPARIHVQQDTRVVAGSVIVEALRGKTALRLRVTHGIPYDAKVTVLNKITVGRGEDCVLTLVDPRVSRLHAEVSPVEGGVFYKDCSMNGSFFRGRRVESLVLRRGDAIVLGDSEVVLE